MLLFSVFSLFTLSSQAHEQILRYNKGYHSASLEKISHNSCQVGEVPDNKNSCKERIIYRGELTTTDPITGQEYRVAFRFYRTTREGSNPLVLFLPTMMDITILETDFSDFFARNGMNALILEPTEDILDPALPLTGINHALIKNTKSARTLIDMAANLGYVNTDRIGGFGGSLGGCLLLLLMGVEPRIHAGVVLAGSGNYSGILAHSQNGRVSRYRRAAMERTGHTDPDEFHRYVNRILTVDPLRYAENIRPDSLYMKIAYEDDRVPTAYQIHMAQEVGTPHVYYSDFAIRNDTHVTAVALTLFQKGRIRRFMRDRISSR